MFLELNDVTVDDPKERLYDSMMEIASGKLSKDGFAARLSELA